MAGKKNSLRRLIANPINSKYVDYIKSNRDKFNSFIDFFITNIEDLPDLTSYKKILIDFKSEISQKISELLTMTESIKSFTEIAEKQFNLIKIKFLQLIETFQMFYTQIDEIQKNIAEKSKLEASILTRYELYFIEIISKTRDFSSLLSEAMFTIQHPGNPYSPMIIAGLICSFIPFINIVALIFGIHLIRVKDYRGRSFGFLILLIFFIGVLSVFLKI